MTDKTELGEPEIQEFINYLAVKERVSASTQKQALCALLFLYKQVLGIEIGEPGTFLWFKKPQRLPVGQKEKSVEITV